MTFLNLMTQQVVVSRLVAVSGNKTNFETVTSENVCIQRMSDLKRVGIADAIGKVFRLYADEGADIEKGDKLVDSDTGDEYKVVAVSTPAQLGAFVHIEATIVRV